MCGPNGCVDPGRMTADRDERHRVMIHRTNARTLEDGCDRCRKSKLYCDAAKHHGEKACCSSCAHPE